MAVLALGTIGAAIGSTFTGTFLGVGFASWGWTIGAYLGQSMTRTKLPTVYGPRLNDLSVQSSAYGNMIPIGFGRFRCAGNLIWSGGRIERTRTTSVRQSGGKGGGGGTTQTQVEYYYTSSFAIGICEGPILGVRRIWANGELIYNISLDASGTTLLGSELPLTVYPGDEAQNPDPVIESFEGAGNVPGYRGLAYIVFNDLLLLQKWGQNIPNFEFEVITAGTLIGMRASPIYTLPRTGYLEFL